MIAAPSAADGRQRYTILPGKTYLSGAVYASNLYDGLWHIQEVTAHLVVGGHEMPTMRTPRRIKLNDTVSILR